MIEGWAVYTERMMPKKAMEIMNRNGCCITNGTCVWSATPFLIIRCVLGWNEEQGLDLLMNQAFQEEFSAESGGEPH